MLSTISRAASQDKYLSKKDEDSYIKTSVSRVGNEKAKNSKGNTTSYRIEEEL